MPEPLAKTDADEPIRVGIPLLGVRGIRIGRVEAVFADYLLVRTVGLLPVDLYVPRPDVTADADSVRAQCGVDEAYARWHRPLKRAPHD